MASTDPGLPGEHKNAIDNRKPRNGKRFSLEDTKVPESKGWKESGRPATDLTFVVVEPCYEDEEEARNFAKGDPLKMVQRLLQRCLFKIGDKPVSNNHKMITAWFNAVGATGRKLVESKFADLYVVSEEDEAAVTASGEDVVV